MKKIILVLSILMFSNQYVFSETINIPTPLTRESSIRFLTYKDQENRTYNQGTSFESGLNKKLNQLKELYEYQSFLEKKVNSYSKNYDVFVVTPLNDRTIFNVVTRGLYILNNNNCLGYVLLRPEHISNEEPFLNKLSLLNNVDVYFSNRIRDYEYIKLNVYEKNHDGYIERVFIGDVDHNKYILGETFYPEELDNEFKPEILKSLRIFMRRINILESFANEKITLMQYSKYNYIFAGNPDEAYKAPKKNGQNKIIEEPNNKDDSEAKEFEKGADYDQ